MTEEQWSGIKRWVIGELAEKESVSSNVHEFMRRFGLAFPFYQALLDHIRRDRPGFVCRAAETYHPAQTFAEMNEEPSGDIHFSRSPAAEGDRDSR